VVPPVYRRLAREQPAVPKIDAMWICLGQRFARPRRQQRLTRQWVALGVSAATGALALLSGSGSAAGTATLCVRTSASVARYCGPASASLSVFPDTRFRGGFCVWKTVGSVALLQVRVGAKALDGSPANDGLPYFSLGAAGSRSRPESGNVVAFFRSRRWIGRLLSLKNDVGGGTYLAAGIAGSHGRASGRFRC
jgi:hypothetical protein